MSNKKFNYFIGIDVSKNKLDFVLTFGKTVVHHRVIINSVVAVLEYIKELKTIDGLKMSKAVFGLEQTGIYTEHALTALKRAKANIVLEDVAFIRAFLGKLRGKYDQIDAYRIATFLFKNKADLRLYEQRRLVVVKLANFSALRVRLISHYNALNIPLKEQSQFYDGELILSLTQLQQQSLVALKADIERVEVAIKYEIRSDARIKRLYDLITSVPGVGPITAVKIIISTNEYLDITDPKKFASYSGVAPFRHESGIMVAKPKVSAIANREMKSLLHICAMSAVAHKSDLQEYYLRRTREGGKPKMLVLNAIRYKIILRVFACLRQDRLFEKDYRRTEIAQRLLGGVSDDQRGKCV
jgi:transposase